MKYSQLPKVYAGTRLLAELFRHFPGKTASNEQQLCEARQMQIPKTVPSKPIASEIYKRKVNTRPDRSSV